MENLTFYGPYKVNKTEVSSYELFNKISHNNPYNMYLYVMYLYAKKTTLGIYKRTELNVHKDIHCKYHYIRYTPAIKSLDTDALILRRRMGLNRIFLHI